MRLFGMKLRLGHKSTPPLSSHCCFVYLQLHILADTIYHTELSIIPTFGKPNGQISVSELFTISLMQL